MTTQRRIAPKAARQPRTAREGAIVVAAVGIIVAVMGHAAMGVGIVAVAALVFAIGLLTPPEAPDRVAQPAVTPRRPRPQQRRRRG